MATLIDHVLRLTDHRDRELLELTLSKALIDLLTIQRVVVARVVSKDGNKHWMEQVRLDARGGGKVADKLRLDVSKLPRWEDVTDRVKCVQAAQTLEVAWAGPNGPRITYLPLFADSRFDDLGVIEIHSAAPLQAADFGIAEQLRHVYRNMYNLLAYSDRDALTGLLNRKSLDDAFYSAVLEELDGVSGQRLDAYAAQGAGDERRHRVPANYWLGMVVVDQFDLLSDKHGHLLGEEILLLVARILNNTFRTYDQLYRFDREHFGVLMHCPEESVVFSVFDRFRSNVEKFNFPQVGRVTVSCGFMSVMSDDTPDTALGKTERAVDFAQKSGRNRVVSHLAMLRNGSFEEPPRVGGVDIF
ncbi:MAG: hypothetical protein RL459_2246 [Pseudomonadota bacterium]|jgi:diguanylate cyclase (GGDEF)-like protein